VDLWCEGRAGRPFRSSQAAGDIDGVEQLTGTLELLNRDPLLATVAGVFAQEIRPQARVLAEDRGIGASSSTMRLSRHRRSAVPAVLKA
jgi:RecB family endonuclease NucS